MAKHGNGKGRKFGRYIKGNIDLNGNLGTLAAVTGILLVPADVVEEKAWISSVRATYALAGISPVDNMGPIQVGIAHSDYTLSEIEAWIEQSTGWAEGDRVAQEISNRLIRRIGTFEMPDGPSDSVALNLGKPITTKLNWILVTGQNVVFWVYNEGSVAIATTDPNVHIVGHANLWPR